MEFQELVDSICKRRQMYVAGGTFYEVCAYVSGYAEAAPDCPLGGHGWKAFSRMVCVHFNFPQKYGWPSVIKMTSTDDDAACEQLNMLLTSFIEKSKDHSYDEIVRETAESCQRSEQEPEQALRALLVSLWSGDEQQIRPLILEHPDAGVLWEARPPANAAAALAKISASYAVGRLPHEGTEEEIHLLAGDFPFPIAVRRVDDAWKVDATPIIEMRIRNRATARTQPPTTSDKE